MALNGGAMQVVEKHVSSTRVFLRGLQRAVFQQQMAGHAQFRGTGSRLPSVVGLRGSLR